jgi:hypothetical protein
MYEISTIVRGEAFPALLRYESDALSWAPVWRVTKEAARARRQNSLSAGGVPPINLQIHRRFACRRNVFAADTRRKIQIRKKFLHRFSRGEGGGMSFGYPRGWSVRWLQGPHQLCSEAGGGLSGLRFRESIFNSNGWRIFSRCMRILVDSNVCLLYIHVVKRISMFIPEVQLAALRKLSKKSGIKVSELVRRFVEEGLKKSWK